MNIGNPLSGDLSAKVWLIGRVCSSEKGIKKMLANAGYRCHFSPSLHDAAEAIQPESGPDILLVSNEIVGDSLLETVREMGEGHLPVIVIVDNPDAVLPDACKKSGVDGFLLCPIDSKLLELTIDSALRLRRLYRYQLSQRKQLLNFQHQIDLEREVAAKIYNNVLQSNYLETEVVNSSMSPMSLFNGDLLLVERTPDNHLYLLLGDFTGHGLSAAVVATPAAEIFYGMARKGFDLADIVRELNSRLSKLLPTNRFLAATAVALYPDSKTLSVITCGLPEHILVDTSKGDYKVIQSKNIPLGIERLTELSEQNFSVTRYHHLFLATDGVFDAENIRGESFGIERVIDAVCKHPAPGFERLKTELAIHSQGLEQRDDISFVELICDVETVPWQCSSAERETGRVQALNWRSSMEFNVDALRLLNPVPVIVNSLMEIQGLQQYRQSIFLIIGELFANALDHGVLGLDSAIKATPEGFMRFYELKEQRIQNLQQGRIRLSFAHSPTEKGGRLTVKVVDSGDGFDWRARLQQLEDNTGFCGRGLKLLETLCTQLTFHGKGNRVTAVFDWRN